MKILITGATGLLGKKLLIDLMKKGHTVIGVCRDRKKLIELPHDQTYSWDALSDKEFPIEAMKNCDAVIHLAGEPVAARRWNKDIKINILESRTRGTEQIVSAMKKLKKSDQPSVFISGSAIGFYGDRGEQTITESTSEGKDFLADVVEQWEYEAEKARELGIRTVVLRTGIVLAKSGGALKKMPPVVVGSGQNFMSWIHIQDWVNFVIESLDNLKIIGVYNLVSPNPVTQTEFIKVLAGEKHVPVVMKVPQFVVSIALGEMAQVLLASQKVIPERILESGFKFKFPQIKAALKEIYQSSSK